MENFDIIIKAEESGERIDALLVHILPDYTRSQLQKLFHQQTGHGVMDYFSRMKIKAARQMIRDGRLNFTQKIPEKQNKPKPTNNHGESLKNKPKPLIYITKTRLKGVWGHSPNNEQWQENNSSKASSFPIRKSLTLKWTKR